MRTLVALFLCLPAFLVSGGPGAGQSQGVESEAGRGSTHARIHNVSPAHEITLGTGAKVGILDHSFGMDVHGSLYAGGETFRVLGSHPEPDSEARRGYWMALALHEIAPAASIYALDLLAEDEAERVRLIERALDWAVENDLDAITYCAGELSAESRNALDPILERTVNAGVVVVFVDYSHPSNLSPTGFGTTQGSGRGPSDLKVFSYDCTTLMANQFVAFVGPDDDEISRHRPFLARPSIGSVTAGLVALVRSVDPGASPQEVKDLLIETSRPLAFQGLVEPNVPDAFAAISRAVG